MPNFDQDSNKRISRAVQRVEASRPPPVGGQEPGFARPFEFRIGKTAAAIAQGASGTINVYKGHATKGSETWDGSSTLTAYNRYAAVGSGKWVLCLFLLGGWELIDAQC